MPNYAELLLIMEQNAYFSEAQPASSHRHLFCQTKGEIRPFLHLVQMATWHLLNCVPGLGAQWIMQQGEKKSLIRSRPCSPKAYSEWRRQKNRMTVVWEAQLKCKCLSSRGDFTSHPSRWKGVSPHFSLPYLQTLEWLRVSFPLSPSVLSLLCRAGGDAERERLFFHSLITLSRLIASDPCGLLCK